MSTEIPVPVTFNPYKHHFLFLLKEIEKWKSMSRIHVENELKSIGSNLIDFYLGNLDLQQIYFETIDYFRRNNISDKTAFTNWLNTTNFKKIQLSDKSKWLIKEGINPERYIHIHPAKFSAHTIRVRATTLKTVIAIKIQEVPFQNDLKANLYFVNKIRQEIFSLSPIKSLAPGKGILRLWELFEKAEYS